TSTWISAGPCRLGTGRCRSSALTHLWGLGDVALAQALLAPSYSPDSDLAAPDPRVQCTSGERPSMKTPATIAAMLPTSSTDATPWIVRLSPKNSAPMMVAAMGSTTVIMGSDAA